MGAAIIRLGRVLLAQVIAFGIANLTGVNIPYLNISVGAVISAVAKFLRDKYAWEWLPV
jgi:hypothetical protein